MDELFEWAEALRARLQVFAGTGDVEGIATAFADTVAARRRFCVLLAALATVLEHNVSEATVIAFKRHFLAGVSPVSSALAAAMPALEPAKALEALSMLMVTASGAWPHSNPPPVVVAALRLPELAPMRLDFHKTIQSHAAALLRGV